MKNTTIFLFSLLLLFAGCKSNNESKTDTFDPKTSFRLTGTIQGGENQRLWLEEMAPDGQRLFIDSIPLDAKGQFTYAYSPQYQSLYNLHTTPENYIVLLPDTGETLDISGQWDNFSLSYKVSGSPESILLWQMQQFYNDGSWVLRDLVDTLNHYDELLLTHQITQKKYDAHKAVTDSIYHNLFREQQEYICNFIQEHQGSLATLIALYRPFNTRPLIDPTDPNSILYYDLVLKGLEASLPDNPHTLHFKNTTEHQRSALKRQEEVAAVQAAAKKIKK